MRQAGQRGHHLAGLVGVVVDGLLAQDHQLRLFLVDQRLQQLGHGQRLQVFVRFHQDAAVGTDGHRGAQGFLALRGTARHGDDFGDNAGFLQAHGLFDGDFVEGVHAHLDVGQIHARAVRLDADLDVEIHHPLDCDEYFHALTPLIADSQKFCSLVIITTGLAAPLFFERSYYFIGKMMPGIARQSPAVRRLCRKLRLARIV
ncbi:hypothetical protein D3C72_1353820 [compost metagenome]